MHRLDRYQRAAPPQRIDGVRAALTRRYPAETALPKAWIDLLRRLD